MCIYWVVSKSYIFCHERGAKAALNVDNSISEKNKNRERREVEALHTVSEEPSKTLKRLEESYQSLRDYIVRLETKKSSFQENE